MCGIFGMIGKSNVVPNVLGGIEGLEYRGYRFRLKICNLIVFLTRHSSQ